MKIYHVIPTFPPTLGGMENSAINLVAGLSDAGESVEVFTSRSKGVAEANPENYITHRSWSVTIAHTPILFSLFFKLLFSEKPSVMHIHIAQVLTPEVATLVCLLRNIPYIAHIHLDVGQSGRLGFLLEPYKKLILTKVLNKASGVVCLTRQQKNYFSAKYNLPPNKVTVIPNGVSKEFFQHNPKLRSSKPIKLLIVGRISAQKNLAFLLDVMDLLKDKAVVDVVGDGELYNQINTIIKVRNLSNVHMVGKKFGQELVSYYHNADMYVVTSYNEGMSLSMLEAMAAGLPIIGSNKPGVSDLISDCGIVCNDYSPKSYVEQILRLYDNMPRRRILSQRAIEKAHLYSWQKIARSFQRLYTEVSK